MGNKIHPTAIIEDGAIVGNNVEIGAYSLIGNNVEIGDDTVIRSHVVITGRTKIGKNNIIFPFAVVGGVPQDLKYEGEDSLLTIGDNNTIREHVTIHLGTKAGAMVTKIGNDCLFMVGAHIAHDCVIGNNIILANNVGLAGHVEVEDFVIIGALSGVHQFVKIGKHAIIGGASAVESNIIPYAAVMGERASLAGLNLVGLKRRSFDKDQIHSLRAFYKKLFIDDGGSLSSKIKLLTEEYQSNPLAMNVINFLQEDTSRPICKPRKMV